MGTTSTNTNVNRRQRNDDDKATNQAQTSPSWSSKSQTSLKPTYQKIGKTSLKKIKFHSKSCEDVSKQERVFNKLDPKNPQHARKIQQRQKAIGKGKNTVGYDIYCRSVNKEKRQKRSMITPSTPDHTLDVPNKKWNGMIRSWRISLHRYDPVDLQHSFDAAQEAAAAAEHQKESKSPSDTTLSVKEKELANSGLLNLVEVTNNEYSVPQFPSKPTTNNVLLQQSIPTAAAVAAITPGGIFDDQGSKQIISGFDKWEDTTRGDHDDASFFSGDDDSDDDLL